MIKIIEKIANYSVNKNYLINMPKGVRGRSSNNDLARKRINWDCRIPLKIGLEKTYKWIESQIIENKISCKFKKN